MVLFITQLNFLTRNTYISLDEATSELIWHPRLSFLNLKSVEKISGFGYKEFNPIYVTDQFGNNMEMNEKIKVTVYCNFEFQSFPFDEQECDLSLHDAVSGIGWIIISEEKNLFYKWNQTQPNEKGWAFIPNQHEIPYSIRMKSIGTKNLSSDGYEAVSCHTIRFSLKRNSLDLLIGSFYLPTGLFAFLSICSYIIDPEIVSANNKSIALCFLELRLILCSFFRFLEGWDF